MHELRFNVGTDINETSRRSGAPEFEVEQVNNTLIYSAPEIPSSVAIRYSREQFEVSIPSAFSFAMYANAARNSVVEKASIQLSRKAFSGAPPNSDAEHRLAQQFVESMVAQFHKGRWTRYAPPGALFVLTGRSSYLDEAGNIEPTVLDAIDPAFRIPEKDWAVLVTRLPRWRWVGDGVLATMSVQYLATSMGKVSPYQIKFEFDLLDAKLKQDADNMAEKLAEGDKKGWNSTAKFEAEKKAIKARNERLRENAVQRGDSWVPISAN